jgi:hypothetical protein
MRNIFILYLQWHFLNRPKVIWRGWKDCLRFNLNYWSVPLLLKTLFSHWRRYRSSYGRGFDLKIWFNAFVFNMISRVLGALMRSVLIFIGLLTEILVFFAGAVVFLLWLLLPFLVIFGIIFGFKILF